tara:strand:- start:27 stop:251 length:225 start_codon:yes stop_codon:yes gene_type:complete
MIRFAYEIAGLKITNEQFTKSEFNIIKRNNPGITLDSAILIFEKAKKGVTLEKFALKRHRTPGSYRKVFGKYFY